MFEIHLPHVAQPALINQVDDLLHLVDADEIGDFRLVAGLDKRLEAGLHQGAQPAAEHRLLGKQVGLGLLGEGGFDSAGPGAADRLGVGQGERESRMYSSRSA